MFLEGRCPLFQEGNLVDRFGGYARFKAGQWFPVDALGHAVMMGGDKLFAVNTFRQQVAAGTLDAAYFCEACGMAY